MLSSNDGVRLAVTRIVVHPAYDNDSQDYDIALLELASPLIVEPITLVLPAETALFAPGVLAAVIGWGDTVAGWQPQ